MDEDIQLEEENNIITNEIQISTIMNTKDINTAKEYIINGEFISITTLNKYNLDTKIKIDGLYTTPPSLKDYKVEVQYDKDNIKYTIFNIDENLELIWRVVDELPTVDIPPRLVDVPFEVTTLLYDKIEDEYNIIETQVNMGGIGGYNYEKL